MCSVSESEKDQKRRGRSHGVNKTQVTMSHNPKEDSEEKKEWKGCWLSKRKPLVTKKCDVKRHAEDRQSGNCKGRRNAELLCSLIDAAGPREHGQWD